MQDHPRVRPHPDLKYSSFTKTIEPPHTVANQIGVILTDKHTPRRVMLLEHLPPKKTNGPIIHQHRVINETTELDPTLRHIRTRKHPHTHRTLRNADS
jgi:hypothetical protein